MRHFNMELALLIEELWRKIAKQSKKSNQAAILPKKVKTPFSKR